MRRTAPLLLVLALTTACGGSLVKDAFNAESALVGAYKVAAPLRADLCRDPKPVLPKNICDQSLAVLEVQYKLALGFNELLAKYVETSDQKLLDQIRVLLPLVVDGAAQVESVLKLLKAPQPVPTASPTAVLLGCAEVYS